MAFGLESIMGTAVPEGCSIARPNPTFSFADVWFAANAVMAEPPSRWRGG